MQSVSLVAFELLVELGDANVASVIERRARVSVRQSTDLQSETVVELGGSASSECDREDQAKCSSHTHVNGVGFVAYQPEEVDSSSEVLARPARRAGVGGHKRCGEQSRDLLGPRQ